jgi:transposase
MQTPPHRKPYPSDVSNEEWAFIAPYLTLLAEDAGQRRYPLREVFNALRWMVRAGAPWRLLPTNFPPWPLVYQQTRRWLEAGCFEAAVHDLRVLLRRAAGRRPPGPAQLGNLRRPRVAVHPRERGAPPAGPIDQPRQLSSRRRSRGRPSPRIRSPTTARAVRSSRPGRERYQGRVVQAMP